MSGDMFQEMTGEKLQYRMIVIASTLIGFTLGLVGLSKIVKYTVPWLVLLYPSVIVLILTGLYYKFDRIRKAVTVGNGRRPDLRSWRHALFLWYYRQYDNEVCIIPSLW